MGMGLQDKFWRGIFVKVGNEAGTMGIGTVVFGALWDDAFTDACGGG